MWPPYPALSCPARRGEAASRAGMKKLPGFPLSPKVYKTLFHIQDSIWSSSIMKGWGSPQTQMKESDWMKYYNSWHFPGAYHVPGIELDMHYFVSSSQQGEGEVSVVIIIPVWQVRKLRSRKVKWCAHDHTARKWKGLVCLTPKPMLSPTTPWLTLPRSHSTRTWTQASWLLSRSSVYSVTTVSPSHLYRGAARPPRGRWSEGELGLMRIKFNFQHIWVPHAKLGWDQRNPSRWFYSRRYKHTKSWKGMYPEIVPF